MPAKQHNLQQDDDLIDVMAAAAARAEQYLEGKSMQDFQADTQLQDAISGCLLVIGLAAQDVSEMLRNWTSHVPWSHLDALADWHLYADRSEAGTQSLWETTHNWLPTLKTLLDTGLFESTHPS